MDKNKWYYENTLTGQISSEKEDADFWADFDGVDVNCLHWSNVCEEWQVWMVREGQEHGYRRYVEDFYGEEAYV